MVRVVAVSAEMIEKSGESRFGHLWEEEKYQEKQGNITNGYSKMEAHRNELSK